MSRCPTNKGEYPRSHVFGLRYCTGHTIPIIREQVKHATLVSLNLPNRRGPRLHKELPKIQSPELGIQVIQWLQKGLHISDGRRRKFDLVKVCHNSCSGHECFGILTCITYVDLIRAVDHRTTCTPWTLMAGEDPMRTHQGNMQQLISINRHTKT